METEKKIEINAQHHMFKARPFDWYHFGPLLVLLDSPFKVKNKPCERAMNVRLFLELLARLQIRSLNLKSIKRPALLALLEAFSLQHTKSKSTQLEALNPYLTLQ
jgi:hypothetical protein